MWICRCRGLSLWTSKYTYMDIVHSDIHSTHTCTRTHTHTFLLWILPIHMCWTLTLWEQCCLRIRVPRFSWKLPKVKSGVYSFSLRLQAALEKGLEYEGMNCPYITRQSLSRPRLLNQSPKIPLSEIYHIHLVLSLSHWILCHVNFL